MQMKPEKTAQTETRIDNLIESNKDLGRKLTEALFIIGYRQGAVEAEHLELQTLKARIDNGGNHAVSDQGMGQGQKR